MKIVYICMCVLLASCGEDEPTSSDESAKVTSSVEGLRCYTNENNGVYIYFEELKGDRSILCISTNPVTFNDTSERGKVLEKPKDLITPSEVILYFSNAEWVDLDYRIDSRRYFGFVRYKLSEAKSRPQKIRVGYYDKMGKRRSEIINF